MRRRLGPWLLASVAIWICSCQGDSGNRQSIPGDAPISVPPSPAPTAEAQSFWDLSDLAFSPNGRLVATSGNDYHGSEESGEVCLWDVETHRLVATPLTLEQASDVAFSPDGRLLAAVDYSREEVRLWDVRDAANPRALGQPLRHGSGIGIIAIEFSPDGQTLATSGGYAEHPGEVRFWDTATQQVIGEPLPYEGGGPSALAFSPDGQTFAAGFAGSGDILTFIDDGQTVLGGDGTDVRSWEVNTGEEREPPAIATVSSLLAVSRSGQVLAYTQVHAGAYEGESPTPDEGSLPPYEGDSVALWDMKEGHLLGEIAFRNESADDVGLVKLAEFSPDGNVLAVVWRNNEAVVELWDVRTRSLLGDPLTIKR